MRHFKLVSIFVSVMTTLCAAQTTQRSNGLAMTDAQIRARLDAMNKKAATMPVPKTYCWIPIIGEIGTDVTAERVERTLMKARFHNPDYIILYFDTNGGSVAEVHPIIDAILRCKPYPIIAYVNKAYSADAVIAFSCPRIYMTPNGVIGAAVAFKQESTGLADVDAKLRSVWLTEARSAAESGGHSPLLAEGLIDTEIALIRQKDGQIIVDDGLTRGTSIKAKGDILCLTGKEAVQIGLADGVVEDHGLCAALGLKNWRDAMPDSVSIFNSDPQVVQKPKYVSGWRINRAWRTLKAQYPDVPVQHLWDSCVNEADAIIGGDDQDKLEKLASAMFYERADAEEAAARNPSVLQQPALDQSQEQPDGTTPVGPPPQP